MEIQLSNSNEKTIVDSEVATLLECKKIYLNNKGYAIFIENGKTIMVHRFVFKHFNPGVDIENMQIDHRDCYKLNNRIENLRVCTGSLNKLNIGKNSTNTSGIKNISYNNRDKKWCFKITLNLTVQKANYRHNHNEKNHGAVFF